MLNGIHHILIERILKERDNNSIQNVLYMAYNMEKKSETLSISHHVAIIKKNKIMWCLWLNPQQSAGCLEYIGQHKNH